MIAERDTRDAIVRELTDLLNGGHAHATLENAVKGLPVKYRGIKPEGLPYSIWQLVEHIRIAQCDILEFSKNPGYKSPVWPDDYWPSSAAPADEATWKSSLRQVKNDLKEFISLLENPANDLYTPFAHGEGQNLLREALLIADHTSYHVGQIIVIRRILGIW